MEDFSLGKEFLRVAPREDIVDFLDRVEKELMPKKEYEHAINVLKGILCCRADDVLLVERAKTLRLKIFKDKRRHMFYEYARMAKPCPCCGGKELYAGPTSGTSYGIRCIDLRDPEVEEFPGCRLKLELEIPDELEDGHEVLKKAKGETFEEYEYHLAEFVLKEVLKRWNRRESKS